MTALPPPSGPGGEGSGRLEPDSGHASPGPFESVLDAVERAATDILDEAEKEANRRVADAEARAERIAHEKALEVTRLTDAMLTHAQTVNQRAEELLRALDEAMRELGDGSGAFGALTEKAPPSPEPSPVVLGSEDDQSHRPLTRPEPSSTPQAEPLVAKPAATEREPLRTLRDRFKQLSSPPSQLTRPDPAPGQNPAPAHKAPVRSRPTAKGGEISEGAVLLATQMSVAGGSREQIEARLRNDFGIEDPGAILDRLNV